ncbi:hypothetical protein Aperf_G00000058340 [Anoplocephala perfoliata]
MPVRTSVHNDSTSLQSSPSGLPRRSNSVSCSSTASSELLWRLKRNRHGSGASVGCPDGQAIPRKSRRNRSSTEESTSDSPDLSDFLPDSSRKCFADSGESDRNSRIDVIKTVVEEVVVDTEDVSGAQTPQSNDEEGNNSENDDEQVTKSPSHTSFHVHMPSYGSSIDAAPGPDSGECGDNKIITNQRSLNSSNPSPSVPCSISCDPEIPSTSKSSVSEIVAAFRGLNNSLSHFSSVTSLVDSVIEPLSMVSSPGENLGDQEKPYPVVSKSDYTSTSNTSDCNIVMQHSRKRKSYPESSHPLKTSRVSQSCENSSAENDEEPHVYPLRSRLRYERERQEWEARQAQPRKLDTLPIELISRIVQYLSVQDLFAMQCLNKRLRIVSRNHLSSLKRINFSSGLPFAYLPEKLDDAALRRVLACTPEVTHILGFYPRHIYESTGAESNVSHVLTYEGVIDAFRNCNKLRSVELMDVGLMSRLVSLMPNVKFHGMFRNRPDSWDSEYAVPLPPEPPKGPSVNPVISSGCSTAIGQATARLIHQQVVKGARLARWFEPITEAPLIQGSPMNPVFSLIYPPAPRGVAHPHPNYSTNQQQQQEQPQQSTEENTLYNSMMTFAIALSSGSLEGAQARFESGHIRRSRSSSSPLTRRQSFSEFMPGIAAAASAAATAAFNESRPCLPPVSPFHLTRSPAIPLPEAIVNLTKLDLVAVPVTILPRLDNVKYLHLKWVNFSNQDPFVHFQANKLQSFVMNNCVGPRRYIRFIRLFVFLTRATQIMRLELVGSRFVEGLFEQLIDRHVPHIPCFRNLQRFVMTGDRNVTVSDVGLVLFCAQQSLTHVALQTFHCDNALFEALNFARVRFSRLENLILGYQDPYLSRLSPIDIHNLDLYESPDTTSPFCSISNRGLTLALSVCPRISNLTIRHAPYITRFPRGEEILAAFPAPSSPSATVNSGTGLPTNPPPAPSQSNPPQQTVPPPSGAPQSTSFHATAINVLSSLGLQQSVSTLPSTSMASQLSTPSTQSLTSSSSTRGPSPFGSKLILKLASFRSGMPVKCLTLENCPGLSVIEMENMIARSDPFSLLESLVLRDMFPLSRATFNQPATYNWSSRWLLPNPATSSEIEPFFPFLNHEGGDYRKLGLLLTIADLLASRFVSPPPLSSFGIGMGASVRDVAHMPSFQGNRVFELPIQPFDAFFILRTHTYLTSLLQMDGSVGNSLRIPHLIYGTDHAKPTSSVPEIETSFVYFASRATQTCVCGLMEWDFFHRMCTEGEEDEEESTNPQPAPTISRDTNSSSHPMQFHLGGPLAFHPQFVMSQHSTFFQKVLCGDWAEKICASKNFARLKDTEKSFLRPLCGSRECLGCSSDSPSVTFLTYVDAPSYTVAEYSLTPKPRIWIARDACVDTSDLRCHVGPKPCVFTLRQPLNYSFSCLTTLHLEKVGITHLVLSCVPRLKNITLENCPILSGILLAPVLPSASSGSPNPSLSVKVLEAAPALKRIRIIRCPKFAIWNWLATVASLYPQHDENLFITYRPFGHYNEAVEQVLWRRIQGAHVTVSHDFSIDRSERAMEEVNSAFEQRFRELMQLTDLINGNSARNSIGSGTNRSNSDANDDFDASADQISGPTRFYRSDRGDNWNLMTDASWMPRGALNPTIEVSLTKPIPPTGIISTTFVKNPESEDVDESPLDGEALREVEARKVFGNFLDAYRRVRLFHRRGVHLHVQHRDVHAGIVDGDKNGQYLTWPYTESYLKSISPDDDFNVWGDGHDMILREYLPPHFPAVSGGGTVPILKREHTPESENGFTQKNKSLRLDVLVDCDNGPQNQAAPL